MPCGRNYGPMGSLHGKHWFVRALGERFCTHKMSWGESELREIRDLLSYPRK